TAFDNVTEIMTVTNRDLLFKTEDEYKAAKTSSIVQSFILEPFGRNTAAAVAAAAIQIQKNHGDDAIVLVLAADHLIQNEQAFSEAVNSAIQLATEGWLVTFGIQPEAPETGFGYRSEEHTSELQSRENLVCRLLLEKKKIQQGEE